MRKTLVSLLVGALAFGALAAPAGAARKPKKVHDSISATLYPFPKDERWNDAGFTKPGCSSGTEGTHWAGVPFTAPGKGSLRFYMEGFEGDWDIYMFFEDGSFLRGDQAQVSPTDPTNPAAPEEEITIPLVKGQQVQLVMCNWASQQFDAEAHFEGTFK